MKKFRLERKTVTDLFGTCFYYHVHAAAETGCLASNQYWMTFVDGTTSGSDVAYFKWYLNPVTTTITLAKRAAAFDFPGIETGSVCAPTRIL
jgi:hypothetical protein